VQSLEDTFGHLTVFITPK